MNGKVLWLGKLASTPPNPHSLEHEGEYPEAAFILRERNPHVRRPLADMPTINPKLLIKKLRTQFPDAYEIRIEYPAHGMLIKSRTIFVKQP
jgi:hypothetical protein